MKTMVQRMDESIEGTGKGAEAFDKLGLSAKDVNGEMKSQEQMFDESARALMKMPEGAEKSALAFDMFGKAGLELMPLLNGTEEDLDALKQSAHDMGLVLSDDAVAAGADFTDMLDNVQRSFSSVVSQVGVKVMPMFMTFFEWIMSNMPTIQKIIGIVFDVIGKAVSIVVKVFTDYLIPAFKTLFDYVNKYMPEIKAVVSNILEHIKTIIQGFVDAVLRFWNKWGGDITKVAKDTFDLAREVIGVAIEVIKTVISKFIEVVTTIWNKWGDQITLVVKTAFSMIKTVIDTVMGVIRGIIKTITGIIEGDWKKVWEGIKETFFAIVNGIKEYAIKYLNMLKQIFGDKIRQLRDDAVNKFKDLKEKVVQWIVDMKDGVIKWVSDMYTKVLEWFGNLKTNTIQKVVDLKDGVLKWFSNMKTKTVESVQNLKKDVVTWFTNMKTDVIQRATDMVDFVKSMPGKMATGIRNGAGKVKEAFLSMWNGVVSAVKKPVNLVIGGANWILGKFNASKIALWEPKIYAKGTDGHMGGPALINDAKGGVYREAIQTPDGETFIPKERNILWPNMPRGTKVLPAGETKKIYAYKKGVGVWDSIKSVGSAAWSGLKKGAGAIWDFVSKPAELVANVIKDRVNFDGIAGVTLDMAKGLVGTVKDKMVGWVKGLFSKHENPADAIEGGAGSMGGVGSTIMGGLGFKGFRKSSPFGYRIHPTLGTRKLHTGVDLAAPSGTPVHAQYGGRVTNAKYTGSYGNMVKITSGAIDHIYAHLSSIIARLGSTVKAGNLIGRVGSTGRSTGPHLHFERRINGRPVHPGYENGGFIDQHQFAEFAEGNKLELVVPMTKPKRAKSLINEASSMLGINNDKEILTLLELILKELRNGHAINIDGRNVFNALSPHMAMATKGRR